MTITTDPFVGVAVPQDFSPISKAYWQTNSSVEEIATRFSLKNARAVTKRAGKAVLRGVVCKDCQKNIISDNRAHAVVTMSKFLSAGPNRVQCTPCFEKARDEGFRRSARKAIQAAACKVEAKAAPVSKEDFYKSWEWRTLRMEAIQRHGRSCQCCGAAPGQKYASGEPVRICVDHIKPISKHWHLRLELSNLQILCDECNMGKGNWSETDFRPSAPIDPLEGLDPSILDQLTDRTTGRLQ